jgi:RNA polymerase sigma-70 factor (ECF subfamily)
VVDPSDHDLATIRLVQAGDAAAFERLYDRYGTLLYSVAVRILRSPAEAEDAAQQAWVQAWRRAKDFDPRRGPVGAWLLAIARSRALDLYRKGASRRRAEGEVAPPAATPVNDPPARVQRIQAGERVRRALSTLEPREREVLQIAYFEGLSQSQIAERLGSPLGSVKSWTRRGLERLRALLPEEGLL